MQPSYLQPPDNPFIPGAVGDGEGGGAGVTDEPTRLQQWNHVPTTIPGMSDMAFGGAIPVTLPPPAAVTLTCRCGRPYH